MAVKEEPKLAEVAPEKNPDKKKFQSKVIVRRLPPDMDQEQFLEQVSPLPDHSYLCFEPAHLSDGVPAFSCAYINFCQVSDLLSFRRQFDGHVFVSQHGEEYTAIVEYAINQRIPRSRNRADPKCATIESDEDYVAFLAQLNEQKQLNEQSTASPADTAVWEQTLQLIEKQELERKEAEQKGVTTPLLDFILQRRSDRRSARRRQDTGENKHATRAEGKMAGRNRRESSGAGGESSLPADSKHRRSEGKQRSAPGSAGRRGRSNRPGTKSSYDAKSAAAVQSSHETTGRRKSGDTRNEESSTSSRIGRGGEENPRKRHGGGARSVEDRSEGSPVFPDRHSSAASPTASEPRQSHSDSGGKVRNKDRPSMAIYRPGMGKYSSRRLQERDSGAPSTPTDETKAEDDNEELSRAPTAVASSRRHTARGKQHGTLVFRRRRRSHERAYDK